MLPDPALSMTVFASFRTSFATWRRAGILKRELGYIRMLSQHLGHATLLTYDANDKDVESREGEIAVTGRRSIVPAVLYSVLAPILHWRVLRRSDVFRAYQLRGAWTPALASLIFRKPFVLRTGYVWSRFNTAGSKNRFRRRLVLLLERFAIRSADLVITASESDRDLLIELHGVAPDKIRVIPNPIDTELFRPPGQDDRQASLVTYVGRLEPQKRVDLLIDAVRMVPGVRLRVIGDGGLRSELEEQAAGLLVDFMGNVPNEQLPRLLAETTVFVLPSEFEGTPKSLLEAMACGCAVVATNVPGNDGAVIDRKTGLVAEPTSAAIAESIRVLVADASLRNRLGRAATEYVSQRHSMRSAAQHEADLIRQLLTSTRHHRAGLDATVRTERRQCESERDGAA